MSIFILSILISIEKLCHGVEWSQNTWDTRILKKSLESTLVHKYKPHEARFCDARFFSGTKNRVSRGLAVYKRF